jgi:hypothetical protein
VRHPINEKGVSSPTINQNKRGRHPNNIAQMIKCNENIRTNSGSGSKGPNSRQW